MHIIEVRRRNAELATAMAQMRTWLDNQAIEPVLFEIGFLPGRETRFRVQFRKRGDALMFAASSDGEVLEADAHVAACVKARLSSLYLRSDRFAVPRSSGTRTTRRSAAV